MSGYLLSIIGTILLSSILFSVLPDGKTSGLIKSVTRLACVLAITSPLLRYFQKGGFETQTMKKTSIFFSDSVIESEERFITYYSEMRIEETEKSLTSEIYEKFHVNVDVELAWEEAGVDGIKINGIYVHCLQLTEEEKLREIWEYLTRNYCSEVIIE